MLNVNAICTRAPVTRYSGIVPLNAGVRSGCESEYSSFRSSSPNGPSPSLALPNGARLRSSVRLKLGYRFSGSSFQMSNSAYASPCAPTTNIACGGSLTPQLVTYVGRIVSRSDSTSAGK